MTSSTLGRDSIRLRGRLQIEEFLVFANISSISDQREVRPPESEVSQWYDLLSDDPLLSLVKGSDYQLI